ncbi:MAG: hypothetical protein R2757_06555 [Draconibacterium sp.]
MKNLNLKSWLLLLFATALFTACDKNDDPDPVVVEPSESYIINYGGYTGDKSTITAYNKETGAVTNNYYAGVNGVSMISNAQHAVSYNGNIYFMGNSADQIFWVDAETFEQTENAITIDIVKPRFGVANGNYLYVSCWGGEIWNDESVSYIAKINITSKEVEKIALPGGAEGLEVVNNKLYAALNYKDSVAVIDLSTEEIEYIETPAVCSYFLKDKDDNLYVTLLNTYSDPSTETGLGYINTSNNTLDAVYDLSGVSSSYINVMTANDDFSKIYVVTEGANWGDPGALAVFDVASKTFDENKFLDSVAGINGVAYYNDRVMVFIGETVTGNGEAQLYLPDGTEESSFETGISPFMLLTVE